MIERYKYQSPSGRVCKRTTSTNNVANMPEFSVGYTYNNLGLVSSMSYPRCGGIGSSCTTPPSGQKSLAFTYSYGQLSAIPGGASSPCVGQ